MNPSPRTMEQDIIAIGDRRSAVAYLRQFASTQSPLAAAGSLSVDSFELRTLVAAMPAAPEVLFLHRRESDGEMFLYAAGSRVSVHIKTFGSENAAEIYLEAEAHFEAILAAEGAPDPVTAKAALDFFARLLPGTQDQAADEPTVFSLPGGEFIRVYPTRLDSNLPGNDDEDSEHTAAVHGLEALLLAMAGQGVALDTPEMHKAVEAAYEAICNRFD